MAPTVKPPVGPSWALTPQQWGAVRDYDKWNDIWTPKDHIIIHYGGGATSAGNADASLSTIEARVRAYELFHINGRGWRGLAYQWWVGQDGTVGRARGWNVSGGQYSSDDMDHDGWPDNNDGVAVLFVMGVGQTPTPAMLASFERLRAWLEGQMGQPLGLFGHQEVNPTVHPTACPGSIIMKYVKGHRAADVVSQEPVVAKPVVWPAILKTGKTDQAVIALRGLLFTLGYGGKAALSTALFDLPLDDMVHQFQTEHGLTVDGIVGPATRFKLAGAITLALT
jgi:hypothetical protein